MRKAILHALVSSLTADTAFLAELILLVWENNPWAATSIRWHENLRTLIRIPSGHMRFVPVNSQADIATTILTSANCPVDLIMISNEAGRAAYMDMGQIHSILAPILQRACGLSPAHKGTHQTLLK